MKRRGFTLSEILIALAIVGVIAAITLPMASKMRPDVNKVLYLTTYDALNSALSNVIVNEKVYPKIENDLIFKNYPLANTFGNDIVAGGRNKLCRALSGSFNILEDASEIAKDTDSACNNTYQEYEKSGFIRSFTNKNGVEFMVTTSASYDTPPKDGTTDLTYQTDLIIDINGVGNGKDCMWSDTCKNPDRFSFRISADGEIQATDPAGAFYLVTRNSFSQKDIDENNPDVKDLLKKNDESFPKIEIIPTTSNVSTGDSSGKTLKDGLELIHEGISTTQEDFNEGGNDGSSSGSGSGSGSGSSGSGNGNGSSGNGGSGGSGAHGQTGPKSGGGGEVQETDTALQTEDGREDDRHTYN